MDAYASDAPVDRPPALPNHDAYASDPALREAVARMGGGWRSDQLHGYGLQAGGARRDLGEGAIRAPP